MHSILTKPGLLTVYAGVFEALIGCMPGLDVVIDRELYPGNRAIPDFVISLPWLHVSAPVFTQPLFEFGCKTGHR